MIDNSVDLTPQLRGLMTEAQILSLAQLSRASGVPRSQLVKLRRGELERIPLGSFIALARVLQVSLGQILDTFGAIASETKNQPLEDPCRQWQRSSLDIVESLILQLPTAAFAAEKNPTAPAVRLLPLLKPLDQLLTSWDVERIGEVGQEIEFNPHHHHWMGNAVMPAPGSVVKVRYVGYFHGDRLLHRAKVDQR